VSDAQFINREVAEMPQKEDDLQQLKGIGKVLVKRLQDAGLDRFAKISQASEKELREIRGINPLKIVSIQEQAKLLARLCKSGLARLRSRLA
jgi:predicted flap endonuclease-1-like 5' DNA nuclease